MKQVIRNCVFETNSSSEHVLSHTCQVGRVPGWEFFFGKVSPLDKEIQFNYSEFEGIWTFSDKFLALCQSYYPFYRDCLQNKIDQIDKLDKWSTNDFSDYYEVDVSFCLNHDKLINHSDFIQFQKDIKEIYQQEYGDNGFELGEMFKEPENPTEILGWIPINNSCYGENPFIFPELFDKHCTTYTNLKNLIKPFLLDRSMIIRTEYYSC